LHGGSPSPVAAGERPAQFGRPGAVTVAGSNRSTPEEHSPERIREFVAVIEDNAGGDLGRRMDEDVDDEALAALARAYNDMLDDWADRFESVDEFGGWLAQPDQQVRWHEATGYFPVHERAVSQLDREGWFDENPHYATAFDQLRETRQSVATSGARIGPFDTVRTMIAEAYEEMSEGRPVDEALERLTDKAERQLRAYESDRS
jgi:methyl-accepting chemotaxis protein